MDTASYKINIKAKKSAAVIGLMLKAKQEGKVIASTKRENIESDFESIILTNDNHYLQEVLAPGADEVTTPVLTDTFRVKPGTTNIDGAFEAFTGPKEIDVSKMDVSTVENMERLFSLCFSLEHLDLTNWDTSRVTNFQFMFCDCPNLKTIDGVIDFAGLQQYDTDNDALRCQQMFGDCKSLKKVKLKNVPKWFMRKCTILMGSNITRYGYEWMGLSLGQFEIVE